ncbi:AMP-binding protein [Novosphingobium panipatense]
MSDDLLRSVEAEVHPTDQMIEIYTSGSMALPKGVRHGHGAVCLRSHTLRKMMGHVAGKRVQCPLPMFWVGGLMMYLVPGLEAGATVVCTERTLSDSRFAMGSVLAEEDLAAIRGPKPWWGLGMSETLGPYSWGDDFRAPGRPVCAPMDHFAPGYDIRIADADNRPVTPGRLARCRCAAIRLHSGCTRSSGQSTSRRMDTTGRATCALWRIVRRAAAFISSDEAET